MVSDSSGNKCFEADYYPFDLQNDYNTTCSPTYKFAGGRLANYHKLERELRFLETKFDLEARQRAKQRAKQMCKAYKRGPKKY